MYCQSMNDQRLERLLAGGCRQAAWGAVQHTCRWRSGGRTFISGLMVSRGGCGGRAKAGTQFRVGNNLHGT